MSGYYDSEHCTEKSCKELAVKGLVLCKKHAVERFIKLEREIYRLEKMLELTKKDAHDLLIYL